MTTVDCPSVRPYSDSVVDLGLVDTYAKNSIRAMYYECNKNITVNKFVVRYDVECL